MNVSEQRLAELNQLKTLSDAEMKELVSLRQSGTFQFLPNLLTLGVLDLQQAVENLKEGAELSKCAYESGCFIEVISLRLQHIDFWLRAYWVVRNKSGKIFDEKDKRPFGALIDDCEKLGFDGMLIDRMRSFNASRVDSIHKYLLGAIRYADLRSVCDKHKGLDSEVRTYTCQHVGMPL